MNIPNSLSIFRLILIPCFIFAFFMANDSRYLIAALIFVISGLTDCFDGYIARKTNQVTDLGKLLDPVADKLTQLTVFVCLWIDGKIPLWLVAIYAVKELTIAVGSSFIYNRKDFVVSSKWYGKFATIFFYIGILIILVFKDMPIFLKDIILYMMIGFIVISCILYAISYRDLLKKQKT